VKAIILAAGVARRLAPLTDHTHKCLLPVGERSLLDRMLDALAASGVEESVLVLGHCQDQVRRAAGTARGPMRIGYVENPDYQKGSILSLWCARETLLSDSTLVMDADVPVVESGGKTDFQYGTTADALYPPTKVDRTLHDGDEVKLGDAVLVAHLTPGHTKGCTTWTMNVKEGGKTYRVVIVGSPNVNAGYKLVGNSLYPQIVTDFERTFKVLKSLPVDIFLGAHGGYFDMEAKYARLKDGVASPFIDPDGYKKYVDDREKAFRNALAKQQNPGSPK